MLRYSYGLLALALFLTVVGLTAALWHMAGWIAVIFVAMVVASQAVFFRALSATGANTKWRSPSGAVEGDTSSDVDNKPRSG